MLSAIILTKNEEKNIEKAIVSVKFCDEIIIVDDNSTDQTVKVAKNLGAKIFTRSLDNDYAGQRNFGLSKSVGDWVLFVDADEVITQELAQEIKAVINSDSQIIGYYISRQDKFMGKILKHGETANIKLLRLAKKKSGIWVRPVHETWKVSGQTKYLKNKILHTPHADMSSFLASINLYTTIEAKLRSKDTSKFSFFEFYLYPPLKFIQNYFLRLGFLDGFPGLVMAYTMSLHSLILRVKLYEELKTKSI